MRPEQRAGRLSPRARPTRRPARVPAREPRPAPGSDAVRAAPGPRSSAGSASARVAVAGRAAAEVDPPERRGQQQPLAAAVVRVRGVAMDAAAGGDQLALDALRASRRTAVRPVAGARTAPTIHSRLPSTVGLPAHFVKAPLRPSGARRAGRRSPSRRLADGRGDRVAELSRRRPAGPPGSPPACSCGRAPATPPRHRTRGGPRARRGTGPTRRRRAPVVRASRPPPWPDVVRRATTARSPARRAGTSASPPAPGEPSRVVAAVEVVRRDRGAARPRAAAIDRSMPALGGEDHPGHPVVEPARRVELARPGRAPRR